MTDMTKARYFLLKLFFPVIYAGFFIVQLFINFDTALVQFSDRYQLVTSHVLENHSLLQNGKSTEPVKTKFRLNKSFQPSVFGLHAEIKYVASLPVIILRSFPFSDPYRADPFRRILLLRGPPCIS
jgi:hypothetical protein